MCISVEKEEKPEGLGRRQALVCAVPAGRLVMTCPSVASVLITEKQEGAQTLGSSCLVPQLFLENLVSDSEGGVCLHVCTDCFHSARAKEPITWHVALLCRGPREMICSKLQPI